MNTTGKIITTLALSLCASIGIADTERDCMLEGTVQKGTGSHDQGVSVKFHSMEKYDQDSNCRVRRGEKLEFKLPDDPRLKDAEAGSSVKYRYQKDSTGSSKTELISVGT
ncbi:MAG: hypothetical protein H6985_20280 [Pseudomonadales bacterium]|nr:hypothetical protein [Halioglobus sp.]MCP5131907.1 hypothetical protein [Pseudomonadales bacterium]